LIKATAKLILALNGNIKKSQIASGLAWGVLLGLIPAGSIFWVVLFLVTFLFRHNHKSKLFSMALIKLLSPLLVLHIDSFGWFVLHIEALQPLFTTMYNMPFVPFTRFNNTLVMGGLAGGAVLWLPSFLIFMALIPVYRNHVAPMIRNSKIVKAIGKFPLLKLIEKYLKD
jgi:uncharacterized protein (TIGR03546 family)